jgi:hypothetical protein
MTFSALIDIDLLSQFDLLLAAQVLPVVKRECIPACMHVELLQGALAGASPC